MLRREDPQVRRHAVARQALLVLLVQDLHARDVLLDDGPLVHLAPHDLLQRAVVEAVFTFPLLVVVARVDQRRNDVVVVRFLHALLDADEVAPVLLAALGRVHETVLEDEREAAPDGVVFEGALRTRNQTADTFVRHAPSERLVEVPLVPRQVDLVRLGIGENVSRVPLVVLHDETVDRVAEEQVLPTVRFRQVVRLVRVLIVGVRLHLVARRAEVGGPLVAALDRVRHRLLLIDGLGRERVRAGREVHLRGKREGERGANGANGGNGKNNGGGGGERCTGGRSVGGGGAGGAGPPRPPI